MPGMSVGLHWELPQHITSPGTRGNPISELKIVGGTETSQARGISWGGMLGPEATIWKMRVGIISDAPGFGAAVQGCAKTWVKTASGKWDQEQNFFPAATQCRILPSPVSREAA